MTTCMVCGAAIYDRHKAYTMACHDVLVGYVCSVSCLDRVEMSLTDLREAAKVVLRG